MRSRQLLALVAVISVLAVAISPDRVRPPIVTRELPPMPTASPVTPSGSPLRPLVCTTQVVLPDKIDRLLSFARSPDGRRLAIARDLDPRAYSRALIRSPLDPASRHIQFFDLRSFRIVDDIGPGVRPLWSGSGRFLSYHAPQGGGEQVATDLVIFDTSVRREVARLHTTDIVNSAVAWDGDALVYLDGSDVHRWDAAGDRIMSTISAAYLPINGIPVISPDGRMFVNASGADVTAPFTAFVIEAASGRATTLTGVRWVEWSQTGHRLLARYDDHRELLDENGTVHRADVPFVGTSVEWAPDGRAPLFIDTILPLPTMPPHFRTFTSFDGRPTGITLPLLRGSFDADGRRFIGRWFDGWTPPELHVHEWTSP